MSTHRAAPQHGTTTQPRVERGTVSRFMQQSKQKKQTQEDPDAGWSTVRRKRRGRNPPPPPPPKHDTCCDPMQTASAEQPANWREDHERRVESLRNNPWCVEALQTLKRHAPGERAVVVCYGLGSTYESWNARHQLAFLVLLAEAYEAQSIQLHDPFLSKDELEALEGLGVEQAQPPRSAKPYHGVRSLYFMPHCPAQIYADVLKGFDKALDELLIVGNSFLSYAKRRIGDDLHPGIREALPLLREVRLDVGLAGDALERPFGDLAAMAFDRSDDYDSSDEEAVTVAAEASVEEVASEAPAPAEAEAPAPAALCEAPAPACVPAPAPAAYEAPAPATCEAPAPALSGEAT
jgi:hypothetical protein